MKKIIAIMCFVAEYSYGMDCPKELDVVASYKPMCNVQNRDSSGESMQDAPESVCNEGVIKSLDRSVKIEVPNPNLINQWQDIAEVFSGDETEDNIFETSASTYKEGRFWTVVRKIFQPLQITTSASTMVLITASEAVKNTHPSVSTGLSYGALGSAVTSGVLSLFITKMNSKINQLNKLYKARLARESKDINVEEI